jgi:uncharacterized protein HemY
VNDLLSSISASPKVQANAMTMLARTLMEINPKKSSEIAQLAYVIHPHPFRLKWLVFRLYKSGDVAEAEAMLDTLPATMEFSNSELHQIKQLRSEAHDARLREAKKQCGYSIHRATIEQQIKKLTHDYNEQVQIATKYSQEIEALKIAYTKLMVEKSPLIKQ